MAGVILAPATLPDHELQPGQESRLAARSPAIPSTVEPRLPVTNLYARQRPGQNISIVDTMASPPPRERAQRYRYWVPQSLFSQLVAGRRSPGFASVWRAKWILGESDCKGFLISAPAAVQPAEVTAIHQRTRPEICTTPTVCLARWAVKDSTSSMVR